MKVLEAGHRYSLQDNNATDHTCIITFFNERKGDPGTTNQEVLRALINRMHFLDNELPHVLNRDIIDNLRQALICHEIRHLERLIEKGGPVENIPILRNGHFV